MLLKSKRGRVRSGHNVIYSFLTPLQICCWHSEEKWEQLFFGDKIPHLENVCFLKIGLSSSVRSLIRILRVSYFGANWYGNDKEILQSALRGRYAVSTNTQCPIQPDIRPESRFLPTPPAFDAYVRRVPVQISPPLWYGKTRMVWLPGWWKNLEDMFIRFVMIHERDRQTDRRTPHADIGRAYASYRAAVNERTRIIPMSMTSPMWSMIKQCRVWREWFVEDVFSYGVKEWRSNGCWEWWRIAWAETCILK